jgi:hypothetical protein
MSKHKLNTEPTPVASWQREFIVRETKTQKETWTFSPTGLGKVTGWALMHYTLCVPCNMGDWHVKIAWNHNAVTTYELFCSSKPELKKLKAMQEKNVKDAPEIPEDVWKELFKKTKKIKKIDDWPGNV